MYAYKSEVYQTFWEKLVGLLQSTRFVAAVAALLVTIFGPQFGLEPELAGAIVTAIVSLIVGDSIRPMEELLKSRRFWAFVAAIVATITSAVGMGLDPVIVQQVVLAIAAWIVGDSWRVTLTRAKSLSKSL